MELVPSIESRTNEPLELSIDEVEVLLLPCSVGLGI